MHSLKMETRFPTAIIRQRMLRATVACLLTGGVFLAPQAVRADTTAKDVQVMLKSISFLTSKPSGSVAVAVVFDPANADSKKDGEAIKALLDGASGGTLVPVAKLVGLDQLASLDSQAAVVSAGLSPAGLDALAAATKSRKILTISTDPGCARTGKCVLSVRSDPKVEILFNAAAAAATGVEFLPNFRMMITEL